MGQQKVNKRKSIEMDRADSAWKFAEESKKLAKKGSKEYRGVDEKYASHAKEFPMLILTHGLLNAVAFAYDKKKNDEGWKLIYEHISQWLGEGKENRLLSNEFSSKKCLMPILLNLRDDTTKLRLITNEIISLFIWLKRFVAKLDEKTT